MVIDSLTSTNVFVEKKSLLKIVGNTTTNNSGLLEVDSNGNQLISQIDSGDTPLYRLSSYKGGDGFMLYNPTTKHLQIAQLGETLNVDIDFERGTKYYMGAKLIKTDTHTNNVFEVDLNGLNVLKIFMDGRELKSYSIHGNTITITGSDRLLIDIFSELVLYAYKTAVINSDDYGFEIEYYQYEKIWDKDTFLDGTYLDEMKGIPIDCFESTSITQNVTKTTYRGGFRFSVDRMINMIENTADFNIFNVSDLVDMVQYVGNEGFRMLFVNPLYGRVIILNNCRTDNGVSLVLEKAKNTKKFTLSCGNYIDINMSNPREYGEGRYGREIYSSGVWIHNSHRRGINI